MKSLRNAGLSILILFGLVVGLPSCKEEEPPAPPKLSFSVEEMEVKESDGDIDIEFILDKPAAQDIEIKYEISGTAIEKVKAGSNSAYDYEIISDYLETEIEAGETTGVISLRFYSDFGIENDETIEISIDEVDDGIEVTRDDEINITLKQEDGLVVVLEWGVQTGENYTDVDMDLFLWVQDDNANLALSQFGSTSASVLSPEYFFLPSTPLEDGNYGLSCTYYSGTKDPMNFQVRYVKLVNGDDVSTTIKKGTYTIANLNEWDSETGTDPQLAFTFKKAGSDFTDFSDFLGAAASGSRQKSMPIPAGVKKK